MGQRAKRWLVLAILGLLSAGCATYSERINQVEEALAQETAAQALARLETQPKTQRSRLLYLLNKALLLRMQGELAVSNGVFQQAKERLAAVEPLSVTETTGSLAVADTLRAYRGARYERLLVHCYMALNFLEMGDLQGARVEALQIDERLEGEESTPAAAFPRYLSGLIFEAAGQRDGALIAYRQAHQAYEQSPRLLQQDLLRLTRALGLDDEHARYTEVFGELSVSMPSADQRQLVLLVHSGLAPVRRETAQMVIAPKSGRLIRVALPYLVPRPAQVTGARVSVGDKQIAAEQVVNMVDLARAQLAVERPALIARALSRVVVKHQASRRAEEQASPLGILVNVAGAVTERADTRSWSLLPNGVYLARVVLPAGVSQVTVVPITRQGQRLAPVEVALGSPEAGQTVFRSLHWVHPGDARVPAGSPPASLTPDALDGVRLHGPRRSGP